MVDSESSTLPDTRYRGPRGPATYERKMASYKTDQRHVMHRGRSFHFVSYEARVANPGRGLAALPAMWFLMCAGKRWAVMPHVEGQDEEELDHYLITWLNQHVFGSGLGVTPAP